MTHPQPRALLLVAMLATVGCDRVSKNTAVALLADTPTQSLWHDTVRLELATNSGAFLSVGAEWSPALRFLLLGVGSAVLLVGLGVVAFRSLGWRRPAQVGAALIVAGGGSNLIDRVLTGHVVDFVNIGIGPVRTGIFNIADVAILVGATLLLAEFKTREAPAPSPS